MPNPEGHEKGSESLTRLEQEDIKRFETESAEYPRCPRFGKRKENGEVPSRVSFGGFLMGKKDKTGALVKIYKTEKIKKEVGKMNEVLWYLSEMQKQLIVPFSLFGHKWNSQQEFIEKGSDENVTSYGWIAAKGLDIISHLQWENKDVLGLNIFSKLHPEDKKFIEEIMNGTWEHIATAREMKKLASLELIRREREKLQ